MLMIRLQRVGRKNDPSFRVLVTDSKNSTKSGKFLEVLGVYDPRKQSSKVQLNAERINYWLSMGAKTSDTIHNLLVSKKIISGTKINVVLAKPAKVETPAEPAETSTESTEKKSETTVEESSSEEPATESSVSEEEKKEEKESEAPTVTEEVVIETPVEEVIAETPIEENTEEIKA
ncbi:MAG: 30S ribosomal protein S16 [Candidatus Vogelbacteria bacterium CG22_combo_CG10-13_8_21_14_all_37_9]|uniref:Small ribosomal subunit protein bS16 n=1 Tax=Candidatus Vogelbacteria bacterium CG22_combo_CG10-13_8_21_14_all_37_9 TaxID=1975046 RepID=A0A2H0BK88_9BACT|nr:MAG: 30S ribosomal protein S16 [Candidatus Vogelbacteria bacterium CG22_combo_CG10-13_8_21_14_all_37_9]